MDDYKVVRMQDGSELLPGGRLREYTRAEIMVGELGPFYFTVEKKQGWENELRMLFQQQVNNVRMVAP